MKWRYEWFDSHEDGALWLKIISDDGRDAQTVIRSADEELKASLKAFLDDILALAESRTREP